MSVDDLLQPSLQGTSSRTIYSVGALFAAAFFGGVIAVCIMAALNAQRLNTLARDSTWVVAALVVGVGIFWYASAYLWPQDTSTLRLVNRGLAFVLVGAFYLMHQRPYRSMTMLGGDPPSPYLPVIAASIVGFIGTLAITMLHTSLGTSDG